MPYSHDRTRTFQIAVDWFLSLVDRVPPDGWHAPALGVWTVRDLVGHTSRALSTVEDYLAEPAENADVASATAYYRAVLSRPGVHEAVAERGRKAAAALGKDALAERVLSRVGQAGEDTLVTTPVGGMRLGDYLPTRTVELTVHGVDLAAATGLDGVPPWEPMVSTLRLLVEARPDMGPLLLQSLTGRRPLPEDFNVLA
jgi:uncharacterized protein (TIGR03083 family)